MMRSVSPEKVYNGRSSLIHQRLSAVSGLIPSFELSHRDVIMSVEGDGKENVPSTGLTHHPDR